MGQQRELVWSSDVDFTGGSERLERGADDASDLGEEPGKDEGG